MSITSTVSKIGPQDAQDILDASKSFSNRPVKPNLVAYLTQEILSGAWKVNGEPVILDENGILLDGQHRLRAIIAAGRNVETLVVRGVKKDVFPTIDTGGKRSGGDILALAGYTDTNKAAALLRWIARWENGSLQSREQAPGHELLALAKRHPEFHNSISPLCGPTLGRLGFSRGYLQFLHWATHQSRPNTAKNFWHGVLTGEVIAKGDPAYALRDRVILDSNSKTRFPEHVMLAMAIKAWNSCCRNEKVATLRFTDSEKFPEILGLPSPAKG